MTQTVLLGSVAEILGGGTPSTKNEDYWNGAIPWITPRDLSGHLNTYISQGERHISDVGLANSSAKLFPAGTVIFSSRAPIGYVTIADKPMTTNQGCKGIICDATKLDNLFLYYWLKHNKAKIEGLAGGSTFKEISTTGVRNLEIELPDLETQKKIADILGTLDEKIELNRRMNETLEQMGQALFRHYFIDNPEVEMWGVITLGDKITPRRGKSLQSRDMKEGIVPVVSGGLRPAGFHNEANTHAPVITVSASGANAGFTALWGENVWSADSSFIDTTITPNVYFYYMLMSRDQKRIYEMQTGSGQPHIYPKHIELLELPNAPDELIAKFNEEVSAYFENIEENKKQIQTLTTLRDTLLPRLINGKVKV